VYVNFCTDAKGQYLGNTSPSYQGTIVPGACKENMHGWYDPPIPLGRNLRLGIRT